MPTKEHILYLVLGSISITTIVYSGFYFFTRREISHRVLVSYLLYLLINVAIFSLTAFSINTIGREVYAMEDILYNILFLLQTLFYLRFIQRTFDVDLNTHPILNRFFKIVYTVVVVNIVVISLFRYYNKLASPAYSIFLLISSVFFISFVITVLVFAFKKSRNNLATRIIFFGSIINAITTCLTIYIHSTPADYYPDRFATGLVVFGVSRVIEVSIFSIAVAMTLKVLFEEKVTQQKEIEKLTNLSRLQLLELKERSELIKIEEQKRMGRDLHDIIANSMATARMQLYCVKQELGSKEVPDSLDQTIHQLSKFYGMIRTKSHERYNGAIREEAFHFSSRIVNFMSSSLPDMMYKKKIFISDKAVIKINSTAKVVILLILQEAIKNIVRHAKADAVWISMMEENDAVVLEVKDNGTGFFYKPDMAQSGLRAIENWVNEVDGTLSISGYPHGTAISILIPTIE